MGNAWTLEVDGDRIAWLTFDLPGEKVNKLGDGAMRELAGLLEEIPTDTKKHVLVVCSGKPSGFIAGADIDELARIGNAGEARSKSAAGQEIFERLAGLRIPTVALVDGPCMGGGLELALACRYRLATDQPRTSLGLPEVSLGIIPGWGGTQRLPRLIGLGEGLAMILSGRPADARRAWKIGLVDGIVASEFAREQTRAFIERILTDEGRRQVEARRAAAPARLTRLLAATPATRWLVYRSAAREVARRTGGNYPAPLRALDVVRRTWRRGAIERGLAMEAEAFSELACSPVSRNLVFLFQAGQRLKKAGGGAAAPPVRSAGVVGAGIMGSGIAWAMAQAGVPVRMKDVNWDAVARGMASAAGMCRALVKRRRLTEGRMNLLMHRIAPTVDYTGFAGLDLVVEAVAEDPEIKKTVLREIERHVGPEAIIATNTSSLPLDELASALARPQRFCGMHFFNPVNRMPLVEVVPASATEPRALAGAAELVRRLDKTPLVVGNCAGFLVNRILLPYLVESAWMFEESADIRRIDRALVEFGMPMGPLALVDEVGIDVGFKVARVLEGAYGKRMHVPGALGAVAGEGTLLGRKAGSGFYRYRNGHARPNRRVARLARSARRGDGVRGRRLGDAEIVDRAVLIMVNEAARCLEEGVVGSAEALDMAMILGTGFAPFRGGLLRYADERGLAEIRRRLDELAEACGERFRPAGLIQELAAAGGRFHGRTGAPAPREVPALNVAHRAAAAGAAAGNAGSGNEPVGAHAGAGPHA